MLSPQAQKMYSLTSRLIGASIQGDTESLSYVEKLALACKTTLSEAQEEWTVQVIPFRDDVGAFFTLSLCVAEDLLSEEEGPRFRHELAQLEALAMLLDGRSEQGIAKMGELEGEAPEGYEPAGIRDLFSRAWTEARGQSPQASVHGR